MNTPRAPNDLPGGSVTVAQALATAVRTLEAGAQTPRLEAEVLLAHVLEVPRVSLHAHPERTLERSVLERLNRLIGRRSRGEPVAYLTGRREFWSLDLEVLAGVLIPRPETERLVEAALEHIPRGAAVRVADLGTGCGAVAVAIARERPAAQVVATDISLKALSLARRNVSRTGAGNVALVASDWLSALGPGRFHVVVSNPPYVAENDPHLGRGDLRFEPRIALVAGGDGLSAIREIASAARSRLADGGMLVLEHGFGQGKTVRLLLEGLGYRRVFGLEDHARRDRVSGGTFGDLRRERRLAFPRR